MIIAGGRVGFSDLFFPIIIPRLKTQKLTLMILLLNYCTYQIQIINLLTLIL